MTTEIKAAIVGIGTGSKAHITTVTMQDGKGFIDASGCGSVKHSVYGKSMSYGLTITEQTWELKSYPQFIYQGDNSAWEAVKKHNITNLHSALLTVADEFNALDNGCSKCAKYLAEIAA